MRPSLASGFIKRLSRMRMFVEQQLDASVLSGALFVFTNKGRNKIKVLYWDSTGFALWHKRLEKDMFKWPKSTAASVMPNEQPLQSLLGGFAIEGHKPLFYTSVGL
ncbi:transposase [Glaciecola punicea]|nr:transposase [Glaciecola punicea]